MDLAQLIEGLSKAAAYPHEVDTVEVHHSHISVVFLSGLYAYKVKKAVNLGFLDFSSLEKRRHFCDEEVRLNRRLAPAVYLGVVPVVRTPTGVKVETPGETVEWAVKMERLSEAATLQKRLQRGEATPQMVKALGQRIAQFHAHAETNERIAAFGRFDVVAQNARENFDQAAPLVGVTLSRAVFDRLGELTSDALTNLRPLIESRAQRGMPRDTHGDLHLDHVYVFPERPPPADLVIVDCIEFSERFRYADPVADMAFLFMDFLFHGRRDLAEEFAKSYSQVSGDDEGGALLPFYTAYRAAVRGKVEGFELTEQEVPEIEREKALARARAHWLLALGELEKPSQKPCLLLVGGLPGTGKSTLAQCLSKRANCCLIRSDVVRKELAGLSSSHRNRFSFKEAIYSPGWTDRTYAECLNRAEKVLFEGKRVLVDATFWEEKKRREFLALAARLAVPSAFVLCRAEPEVIRLRLSQRRNDPSDADWSIYQRAAVRWEEPSPQTRRDLHEVSTGGTPEQANSQALKLLRELSLWDD
jgi:aminoglycoside phosphotransferase family enzyme/predicted kinase